MSDAPAPSEQEVPARTTAIDEFVWAVWPWVAWLLPTFLVLRGFIFPESSGWEALILLFASPLLIPAGGLLGVLPRFVMRRRLGAWSVPPPLTPVVLTHWWACLAAILLLEGAGDSGGLDSVIGDALGLSQRAGQVLFATALVVTFVTWIVLVFTAAIIQPHPASPRWHALSWVALAGVPVLLVVAMLLASLAWPDLGVAFSP